MTTILRTSLAMTVLATAASAHAHIGYGSGASSRDFGLLSNGSSQTKVGTTPGNYGWIDASDLLLNFDTALGSSAPAVDNLYFGDAHKATAYRFSLDTTLTVSFTVMANPTATSASIAGLLPGFSVYQGLASVAPREPGQTSADYDSSAASLAARTAWAQSTLGTGYDYTATQGSWNALADWKIGGDGDPTDGTRLTLFSYQGSAWDSDGDGSVTGSFVLGPGTYSLFVGGADIQNKGATTASSPFGMSLTVAAVPEPGTYALMLAGITVVATVARRRQQRR